MIVGLGDETDDGIPELLRRPPDPVQSDPWESQESAGYAATQQAAATWSPITFTPAAPKKTIPRVGATKVLDKVLPKTVGAGGKVTIWGMPPAVAYALALMAVSGVGYVAYRQLGGRRLASNPRRRRRGGRRSRRSKR